MDGEGGGEGGEGDQGGAGVGGEGAVEETDLGVEWGEGGERCAVGVCEDGGGHFEGKKDWVEC